MASRPSSFFFPSSFLVCVSLSRLVSCFIYLLSAPRRRSPARPSTPTRPSPTVPRKGAILSGTSGKLTNILLLDVIPLSLGIETEGGQMSVILKRNTTKPTSRTKNFTTSGDNQTTVTIEVYEGMCNHPHLCVCVWLSFLTLLCVCLCVCLCVGERPRTADNNRLGTFELTGIPPAPRGVPQIDVTFDVDADGILKVTAMDKSTGTAAAVVVCVCKACAHLHICHAGRSQQIIITNDAGRLSMADVQRMLDEASQYKQQDETARLAMEARHSLTEYSTSILCLCLSVSLFLLAPPLSITV